MRKRKNLRKEEVMELDEIKFEEEENIRNARKSKARKNMDIEEEGEG